MRDEDFRSQALNWSETGQLMNGAILLAAGSGQRFGAKTPKQFHEIGGRPLYTYSLEVFCAHADIDVVALVLRPQDRDIPAAVSSKVTIVPGGDTRAASVQAGLAALEGLALQNILIHDTARPGVRVGDISQVLEALRDQDACAPALPVADALKHWTGNTAPATVSRRDLYRVQTPQGFRTSLIRSAHSSETLDAVDDLEVVGHLTDRIVLVEGGDHLHKLTTRDDLARIRGALGAEMDSFRTGNGFDVHAFEAGDAVILCGVEIAHSARLKGHSDADVAWHALTDAILGALADGDIGDHFPPTDPQWKGAPSSAFLSFAGERVLRRGGGIEHVDMTIMCEAPKIKPHRDAMRQSTATCLNLPLDRVSLKATTTEKLGFLGRGEGIAAMATATIRLPNSPQTD